MAQLIIAKLNLVDWMTASRMIDIESELKSGIDYLNEFGPWFASTQTSSIWKPMCVYIYIYREREREIYTYIYIYIERERGRR